MKNLPLRFRVMLVLWICALAGVSWASSSKWPAGISPQEIGKLAAAFTVENQMGSINYQNVCCAYGVLKFGKVTGDASFRNKVEAAYAAYLTGDKINERNNHQGAGVVAHWFGFVAFELYAQTGNRDYLALAKKYADEQYANARPDGLPGYTRFMVDDMYGMGTLQGLAYKHLGDLDYADRGIKSLQSHIDKLAQPNGLFHHKAGKAPFFWGRGNGWGAAAMAELLLAAPTDHPQYDSEAVFGGRLMHVYRKQMKGLLDYQNDEGAWRQLIDMPDAWPETSGTAMIVFALATGVREGWLPEEPYRKAAERGWLALANYVDSQGRLKEVCVGTSGRTTAEKYLGRPRKTGDEHGQAPLLWAAAAMIELEQCPWLEGNRKTRRTDTQSPDYLRIVKDYADTMLAVGRDKYGLEHSPLFATLLDRKTFKMFSEAEQKKLWQIRLDDWDNWGIRNRDRIFKGANPQHDEDLYQVLYALTKITGNIDYARQADRTLKWFLERCQSPVTGLLPWGEHMGWDFNTETIVWKPNLHNGGILLECITHEYCRAWVLWEKSFELAPEACRKFAAGLWEHQIHDHQTGHFSRHAVYTDHRTFSGSEFPRHGGFYIAVWAEAYKRTREPVFAKAIDTVVAHFEKHRSAKSGIIPAVSEGKIAWPFSSISLAVDLWDGAAKVPADTAERMRACASRTDEVFLNCRHDLTPDGKGFLNNVEVDTLKPNPHGAYSGRLNGSDAGVANICMLRYRHVKDRRYRRLIIDTTDAYLDHDMDMTNAVRPGAFGSTIWLMLNAYELTGNRKFLARADHFGQKAVQLFLGDGSPLPKANSKYDHYEGVTGGDTLMMSLLKLWAAQNRPRMKLSLTFNNR